MSVKLSRAAYAGHYGPTVGDRIRLADTDLILEIEKDFAVRGEEVKFGGGKVIRDSQGQSPLPARRLEPGADAAGRRGPADQPRLPGQGQQQLAAAAGGAGPRRGVRPEAA